MSAFERLPLGLLLGIAACTPDATDDSAGPGLLEGPVSLELAELVPTVVRVQWEATEAASSRVCHSDPAGQEACTPWEERSAGPQELLVRGLKPATSYAMAIEQQRDDAAQRSDTSQVTTGDLPVSLATLALSHPDPGALAGGYLLAPIGDEYSTQAAILDTDGDWVWAAPIEGQYTRMRLNADRSSVVTVSGTPRTEGIAKVRWFGWDGELLAEVEALGLHTDFDLQSDGTVVALGRELREQGEPAQLFGGETIVAVSPDGGIEQLWSVFDAFEPELDAEYDECEGDEPARCFTHVNSITWVEEREAFQVTDSEQALAMEIPRGQDEPRWILGGAASTFAHEEDPVLAFPHSVEPADGGVLVFDNESPLAGGCSAAVHIALDEESELATTEWLHAAEGCLVNGFMGNAQGLWNGNVLAVLSLNGIVEELTPEGEVSWRVQTPTGTQLRYAGKVESLYGD